MKVTENNALQDELNPDFLFSLTFTELLSKVAKGEINAQQLAKQELANRGLDTDGKWIGFKKAASESSRQHK